MKTIDLIPTRVLSALFIVAFAVSMTAQEVNIPDPGLNAAIRAALQKPVGPLTGQDMLSLINLDAGSRGISNGTGLDTARNLERLFLDSNHLTNFSLPGALTNLSELYLMDNPLTNCSLPNGLAHLGTLNIEFCSLARLTLPAGLTGLTELDLGGNELSSFTVPPDATNLAFLSLFANQLTNLTLPPGLTRLSTLDLDFNKLPHLALPSDLTSLETLLLRENRLDEFSLPADLGRLRFLALDENQLTQFIFPSGLTNLTSVGLLDNHLTTITLPPDMTQLTGFFVDRNPFNTLVLSEPLAATNLADDVAFLRNRGISVFTYPLSIRVAPLRHALDAFELSISGPPGVYAVLGSTDLANWNELGAITNQLGRAFFTDVTGPLVPQKFYRALLQVPPANMVFVPPNTFTMGTPISEVSRQADEGPQTTVTISRGFWIGKYEVTQREYLAVVGSNPSQFTGNLDRPVETVSWLDATNYCALLTQRELAAGRISPGSRFRLPTEAEWECAARAGTSTRFSYGDDPSFTGLAANAWYSGNAGFGTHPVGQKAPNPWGLYDMEGNVLEWTLDWYAPYPGGSVTDPQGPNSNPQGVKVIRGGAWDAFASDCRSGRRLTEGVSPFIHDFILGFRVVLVTEPQ